MTSHPSLPLAQVGTRIGVLLVNLGTPNAPTTWSVAKYLREFLSDPRVVNLPKLLWYPILYGIILPFRSASSAQKYRRVWTEDSPLRLHAQNLTQALDSKITSHNTPNKNYFIRFAMRYGQPKLTEVLEELRSLGIQELIVIPLFPQFSAVTSASVFDAIANSLKQWKYIPKLVFQNTYHDHPLYIQALCAKVTAHWRKHGKGQHFVFSFHGIPKRQWDAGDPYHCLCQKTARLVAETLKLSKQNYSVCYQSRFGPAKWLSPYTEDVLEKLAKQGITEVDVLAPSFLADCLETIDEIAHEYHELFCEHGGKKLRYIEALNDSTLTVDLFEQLTLQNTSQ